MALAAFGTWRTGILLRTWTPPFNLLLSGPENALRLALIGVCLALGRFAGPGVAALGWRSAHLGRDLASGAMIGAAMAVVLGLAGWAAERRWGPAVSDPKLLRCIMPASSREWPGVVAALLPAAALEELLFRSLPLGGLGLGTIRPYLWMWPLALFFGLLHWPQGSWGVVGTTLAGLMFSAVFLVTGSIWPPLAAHALFNLLQIVLARWRGLQPLRAAPEV